MRFVFLFILILAGCARTITPDTYTLRSESVKFQIIDLTDVFRDRSVEGTVLIYDEKNNQYYSNDFQLAKTKYSPASTFKIANTLVGLENGVIDESHLFAWDGKERNVVAWNQDLILRDAFQYSCVWCYQDLARKIGASKMKSSLDSMKYPGMEVKADNIDSFWLRGNSKISPLEQVDFLKRLNVNLTGLKPQTIEMFKRISFSEETSKGKMYAKTGLWMNDKTKEEGGWYVGFIEKADNRIYFATHITPKTDDFQSFMESRISITKETLNFLSYW